VYTEIDGASTFRGSLSEALSIRTNPAPTSTTLHSLTNPAQVGQSVTFVAPVTPATATGSVNFFRGESLLGTAALANGEATLTTTSLAKAIHAIRAGYGGHTDLGTSTSPAVDQVVE
jgi:hypothetical protein